MHKANTDRYQDMQYRRCGRSGLLLPAISLGLWHNFGDVDDFDLCKDIILYSFDNGINHFDLANNYGPPPGSAECNFGKILKNYLKPYRDEMIISTKAGYYMWDGPNGEWGSRKYLLASLDQSLERMGLDYVDIFYSHRFDPDTPLEETMGALADSVRFGKALYVGISSYPADKTIEAYNILKSMGVRLLIHQPCYSMLERWVENDYKLIEGHEINLLDTLDDLEVGSIAYCPLAQGILTNRYLNGIPEGSRAYKKNGALNADTITAELIEKIKRLNQIALERGQNLAQMSLAWVIRRGRVTSALTGVSSIEQVRTNIETINNLDFSDYELARIDSILLGQF